VTDRDLSSQPGGPLQRRGVGRGRAPEGGSGPCPYLRLAESRGRLPVGSPSDFRCYVGERPEHVGAAYQASVCRATTYQSCPRLAEDRETAIAGRPVVAGHDRRRLPRTGIPSVLAEDERSTDRIHPAATPVPLPAVRPDTTARARKPRRRVTLVEVTVLGLGLSILLAFFFIGYALVYRLQLRSGIEVAAAVPATPVVGGIRPTLVPTFTPTPLPTVTPAAQEIAAGQPTPVVEPTLPPPTPIVRPPATLPPTRLVIPKIDIDIPVLPVGVRTAKVGGKERVLWADVPNAGGFHQTSAYPGNPGNTVINGHRDILGSVFRHLDKVDVGDDIVLYVGDVAYPYRVTETLVVPETFATEAQRAESLKLIGYMPEERLTLITCTPVGLATHRLLVIAKPAEPTIPQMPEAGSGNGP
jgi:sortase A